MQGEVSGDIEGVEAQDQRGSWHIHGFKGLASRDIAGNQGERRAGSPARPGACSAFSRANDRVRRERVIQAGAVSAAGSGEVPRIWSTWWIAASAPSIRPRTAALSRGIDRAIIVVGKTTP